MVTSFKLNSRIAVVVLALALTACSDDDNPAGGGNTDTTPPGVASVTPVDEYHFNVTFSEEVTESSAEDEGHYVLVESGTPSPAAPRARAREPGDTLLIVAASLQDDKKTVAIATGASMAGLGLTLNVTGVSDAHGNDINEPVTKLFTGSSVPDETPPTIVVHSPNAGDTNVALGAHALILFSEPVPNASSNIGWYPSGGEPIPISVQSDDDMLFTLTPTFPLDNGTEYVIGVAQVQDYAGNEMPMETWTFTTIPVADPTPPTLVSTSPANLATNVSVDSELSATFSEPVSGGHWLIVPDPGVGIWWSYDAGLRIAFEPDAPLLANTQYTFTINAGDVEDRAGNNLEGLHVVTFSTGNSLASGYVAGTLTGDPDSDWASDPSGATVIAAGSVYSLGGPGYVATGIVGSGIVAENDTYTISYVPDGVYYSVAILDSNGDGDLDPFRGDAVGAFGIDLATADESPDTVTIAGGAPATGVDFPLYDPSAIAGVVGYVGAYAETSHWMYVGLFTAHFPFDPTTAEPVAVGGSFRPDHHDWYLNSLNFGFPNGDYFVGVFLDVNDNTNYNPAVEPVGFYGESPTNPTAISVSHGADYLNLPITLSDPAPGLSSTSVIWPAAKHNAKFQRLCDILRQSQALAAK